MFTLHCGIKTSFDFSEESVTSWYSSHNRCQGATLLLMDNANTELRLNWFKCLLSGQYVLINVFILAIANSKVSTVKHASPSPLVETQGLVTLMWLWNEKPVWYGTRCPERCLWDWQRIMPWNLYLLLVITESQRGTAPHSQESCH